MDGNAKKPVIVRNALPEDAEEICRVHFLSVTGLAADCYTPRQIELWTGGMKPKVLLKQLPAEGAECLVAQSGDSLLGFGIILGNEIRAVYVRPDAAGHSVGRQLVQGLEQIGRAGGHDGFLLNASLNAQGFYEAMGYTVQRKDAFALNDNESMACVVMSKHT